jgi:hypothetical protein
LFVLITTITSVFSELSESKELSARDIPSVIISYYENEQNFERDYLGKTFIATMFFDTAGGEAFGGGYFVGFHGKNESAGVICRFSETMPHEVIDWNDGKSVYLTGVVYKVIISTLYLDRCEFK